MHTYKAVPLLIAGLLVSSQTCIFAKPKRVKSKVHFIPAFNKFTPGINHPNDQDEIHWELRRTSPDGKYIARMIMIDGEYHFLTVYRRVWGNTFTKKNIVSQKFELVEGCAWVPGHGHWLLVSNDGFDLDENAVPAIALWTGKKRIRLLHSAEDTNFNLRSVASDGSFIIYDYRYNGSRSLGPSTPQRIRRLKLPRS